MRGSLGLRESASAEGAVSSDEGAGAGAEMVVEAVGVDVEVVVVGCADGTEVRVEEDFSGCGVEGSESESSSQPTSSRGARAAPGIADTV